MSERISSFFKLYSPMIFWMSVLSYLSHQPAKNLPKSYPSWLQIILNFFGQHADKVVHFGLYFLLGVFAYEAFKMRPTSTFIVCVVFGLLDETHQLFVPGRSFDLFDWLADCLGLCLSFFCLKLVLRHSKKQLSLSDG